MSTSSKKTRQPKQSRRARETASTPIGDEPETLTAPAAAEAPESKPQGKAPKPEAFLNDLAGCLANVAGLQPLKAMVLDMYGGDWTPDRELSVLRLIKADDRFVLVPRGGINQVGLIGADAEPATATVADPVPETPAAEPVKTLGEHVADAEARPTRVTWHVDVGSSVLLLTPGYPPKKATIRNIRTSGSLVEYDLNTENGGTCDGVLADRIGRDLDAEGEVADLRLRCAALQRHIDEGAELAQKLAGMQAHERKLVDMLKEHRKSMEEVVTAMAAHAVSDAGQTDLRDMVGDTERPTRFERIASKPGPVKGQEPAAAPADGLATEAERSATVELSLSDVGLDVDDLHASRVEQATASTGKPQQIKPVVATYDDTAGSEYALVDVQEGRAVLLPVLGKVEWKADMAKTYGKPMALPSDAQSEALAKGGRWCGFPVRVGRATCWLGCADAALLVRLPEPEAKPVGKEAAAGN